MTSSRRIWRGLVLWGVLVAGALVLSTAGAGWMWLRASLPREQGELGLAGLSAAVTVERDARGVPRIVAETLEDAVRAQGFVHAQERFFQMDMARRAAAGELSAIVGGLTLDLDRESRVYRFRKVARESVGLLPEKHRALLEAYTAGVNAGLADLQARPPEYLALRATPEPWKPEDCILTVLTMFRFLNYTAQWEETPAVLEEALGAEVAAFLTPETTRWDVPMLVPDGAAEKEAMRPSRIPGPELIDLRAMNAGAARGRGSGVGAFAALRAALTADGGVWGSNNWAVSAARSGTNAAYVANDMHLGLSVPTTWFRVQLEWGGRRAVGVSLPGAPGVVAGSTGELAWGFTNVEADVQDHVVVEVDPEDATRYRTTQGWEKFSDDLELLAVRGRPDAEELHVRGTVWGPIVGADHRSRPLALRWSALDADKLNLGVLDMLEARNVDEGVDVAQRMCIPAQNVVMADASGRIAWTIAGWLPERVGFDGKMPVSWAGAAEGKDTPRWAGPLPMQMRPKVIDPPSGLLWTANGRTVAMPHARAVSTTFSPSDRAHRITTLLTQGEKFEEGSLHAIALDTRAVPMDPWRDAFLGAIGDNADALLRKAREGVESWNGTADADQTGYRILRAFRREVSTHITDAVEDACADVRTGFQYRWPLSDEPIARLLETRAPNWLPRGDWADWPAFLRACARRAAERIEAAGGLERPWGEVNRLSVTHALVRGVPLLSDWLALPADPMSGSGETVRAQGRTFGASERFVVSPSRLSSALFSMPAGQSGHVLSRHYRDGHKDWAEGRAQPMLAGSPVRTLRLVPLN